MNDEARGMSEEDFQGFLGDAIREWAGENDAPPTRVDTYAEAGVLTINKGLVVRIGEADFQVTIVRKR
jgi:hypothetical protein